MKYLWKDLKLAGGGERFDAWNNGDVNALGATPVNEFEVAGVVEEHLGNDVFSAVFHLFFELLLLHEVIM